MSGIRPFFITGANARVRLNGKTMAFCTDLSYSVQILTQTPKVLGMYEGTSVEPLGYTVSGSFTVIRYAKDAKANIGSAPHGVASNDAGNGVGNWGKAWSKHGEDGRANEALDPSRFADGTTFDIEVYQKTDSRTKTITPITAAVPKNIQSKTGTLGATTKESGTTGQIGVAKIRNCRITQADFQLTKKGAAIQRFSFVALYADEDSFVADFSGLGHHF